MGRKERRPSPAPRAGRPQSLGVTPNRLPRVQPKADVFQQGAAPRPRPGPPDPSPCSVCAVCLQRQRALHTVLGAPPMIGLQESRRLLQRSRSGPYTQCPATQFPHFLSFPLPVRLNPGPLPTRPAPAGPGTVSSSPGSPLGGSGWDFRFRTQRQPGTPPH